MVVLLKRRLKLVIVANFWKQFWEMARDGSPGPETRDEVLRRHAVTAQVSWRDPTLGEVLYTARLQSGSGGPDGWTGDPSLTH